MRRPSRTGLLWIFVLFTNVPLAAQNIESIGKEKPFSFNGGVSFNQIFYASNRGASPRNPYSYFASANLNFSLYGWNVPLTLAVSNQKTRLSQPFNQYSVHPKWKSITAHGGYTSMSYSSYTVNGHIFRGGGIDLAPEGKWKLSGFYGRLLRAVEPDTAGLQPAFQRNGYGLKVTYGTASQAIDLIVFGAKDDPHSITAPADSLDIRPQENFVVSVGGSRTILKKLVIKAEVATSGLTRDTRSEKAAHPHLLAKLGPVFQPRLSSSYYQAFKSAVDYQHHGWIVGLGYERIDPEYRTLGAYYFNNDLENITINSSGALLEGKLNMAFSMGIQGDNVDKTRVSTMRRIVSAINISYLPSQRLNLSGSWSTFQTYTNIRSQFESINQLTPYENLDTLNFTQISRNASFSGMYVLPASDYKKQSLNLNISWQEAADTPGGTGTPSRTRFYSLNAGYAMTLPEKNTSLALTFNATATQSLFIYTRMMGPNASVTRSFLGRRLRTTLSSSWNKTYANGTNTSSIINGRLNNVISIRNKHHVNASMVFISRSMSERASSNVNEFTATIGYNFSFGSDRKVN